MTYEDIGKVLGCSGENIRKIERKAINKLLALPECRAILDEYKATPEFCSLWETIENDQSNIIFVKKNLKQID